MLKFTNLSTRKQTLWIYLAKLCNQLTGEKAWVIELFPSSIEQILRSRGKLLIEQLLAANLLAASSRSHRFVTFAACSNRPLQQLLRSEVRGKLPQAMCVSLNHFAINGICSRDGSQECLDCQPELANLQTLNQILGLELRLRTKSVSDQLPNRLKGRWESLRFCLLQLTNWTSWTVDWFVCSVKLAAVNSVNGV